MMINTGTYLFLLYALPVKVEVGETALVAFSFAIPGSHPIPEVGRTCRFFGCHKYISVS